MDSFQKIKAAKIALMRSQPFFGQLVTYLKFVKVDQKELGPSALAGVDITGTIYFDDRLLALSVAKIQGVIFHELGHVAFGHLDRTKNRIKELFNVATDSWLNRRAEMNNFELPDPHIKQESLNKQFGISITDEMGSEERYDLLKDKVKIIKVNVCGGFDQHRYGDPKEKSKENGKGIVGQQEWNERIIRAASLARGCGKLPAGFENILNDLLGRGQLPWHRIIRKYLNNVLFNSGDYTYRIPSRFTRIFPDYITPMVDKVPKFEVAIGLDTSGSISDEDYLDFLAEINKIAKEYKGIRFAAATCDAALHESFGEGTDPKKLLIQLKKRTGYGGTVLTPAFDYFKEKLKRCRLILFFSDLEANFPPYKPRQPVIWVQPKNRPDITPPFGKVIRLE